MYRHTDNVRMTVIKSNREHVYLSKRQKQNKDI